jgi:hypothetical protein
MLFSKSIDSVIKLYILLLEELLKLKINKIMKRIEVYKIKKT